MLENHKRMVTREKPTDDDQHNPKYLESEASKLKLKVFTEMRMTLLYMLTMLRLKEAL